MWGVQKGPAMDGVGEAEWGDWSSAKAPDGAARAGGEAPATVAPVSARPPAPTAPIEASPAEISATILANAP